MFGIGGGIVDGTSTLSVRSTCPAEHVDQRVDFPGQHLADKLVFPCETLVVGGDGWKHRKWCLEVVFGRATYSEREFVQNLRSCQFELLSF